MHTLQPSDALLKINVTTKEGALRFAETLMADIPPLFEAAGSLLIQVLLVAQRNSDTGERYPEPQAKLIVLPPGQGDGRAEFSRTVRHMALISDPLLLAFVSEVYMAEATIDRAADPDAAANPEAAAMKARATLPRDLSEAPGRKELVMLRVEHHDFEKTFVRMAEILRETPDGPPKLAPWAEFPMGQESGRMTQLLPPRALIDKFEEKVAEHFPEQARPKKTPEASSQGA